MDLETVEAVLDSPLVQSHLLHMTEYQKESLIELLEQKKLLEYLYKMAQSFWRMSDVSEEAAREMAAPEEQTLDKDPATWTQKEIDHVFKLWREQVPKDSQGEEFDPEFFLQIYAE